MVGRACEGRIRAWLSLGSGWSPGGGSWSVQEVASAASVGVCGPVEDCQRFRRSWRRSGPAASLSRLLFIGRRGAEEEEEGGVERL